MNNYVVYKHTDPEGKVYIGITQKTPRKRFDYGRGYSHNVRFREAIAQFGWDAFHHEILQEGLTQEQAWKLETEYIAQFRSTDPACGYNVKTGGLNGKGMSDEARRTLSERMTGDGNPTRRYGHPFKGKTHSEESRLKMSISAKARTDRTVTDETKEKLHNVQAKKAVFCVDTGLVYDSIHTAARATGLEPSKICAVCQGKRNKTGGHRWEYVKGRT